jgi:Asp-tRNA(Asn)/Glu-tRNA(Gln) amidotransferase A subunit family amidase
MTDLADLSLVEAADAVRKGDATSKELLDACWTNLEAANPKLNATIWLDHEGAEQAARAADRAVKEKAWLGPLHGVPMAHKDMYYQAGAAEGLSPRRHGHRDREAACRRCLRVRQSEHGGVRAEPDRPQS